MSGKVKPFSVVAFVPVTPPLPVVASSEAQLARRLAPLFEAAAPEVVAEVAAALWNRRPVFMPDLGMAILPGSYPAISYQSLGASAFFA